MDKPIKSLLCNWPRGIPAESSGANRLLQTADGGQQQSRCGVVDEMINNIQFIPGDFTRAVNTA